MIGVVLFGLVNLEIGVVEYMFNVVINELFFGVIICDEFYVECFVGNDVCGIVLVEYYFGVS